MLRRSFIIFKGVGEKRERDLWNAGFMDWNELQPEITRFNSDAGEEIERAEAKYRQRDAAYFASLLRPCERWRLLSDFRDETAFIDVELDGANRYSRPAMVGIMRNGRYTCLVSGVDLDRDELSRRLHGAKLIVCYNGQRHDIHFLHLILPRIENGFAVIDLLPVCRKLGLNGGLKRVERLAGIERERFVELAASGNAVRYWKEWKRTGRKAFLNILMRYNREDTCNLEPLAREAERMMLSKMTEGI
ncbi:MAG: ribonuclease H-like domain-containing protein [Candidatus Thermoplasmatota archaeon]|nr:ribonuclease H-like domain-containing protein [Candidatus Thermoplasmatota archaeon]